VRAENPQVLFHHNKAINNQEKQRVLE
jgi:hypothetical protein